MNPAALSLENAPRFWTPVRFFLTVPLFGILGAVILLLDGGQLLQSRWHPATLAVTHAFTLGYIAMGMLGALLQMLPVLMGVTVPGLQRAVAYLHLLLTAGTLCLVSAFLTDAAPLFGAAVLLLVPALMLFALAVVVAIRNIGRIRGAARAAQLAAFALLFTVALGGYLAAAYAFDAVPLQRGLTNYHAAWGFVGWVFILIIGVSAQVIPMFLTTPPYPDGFNRRLVYLLMLLLVVASLLPVAGAGRAATVVTALLMAVYAVVTLFLLLRRRRKRFDITDWFWCLGMVCLLAGAGVLLFAGFAANGPAADVPMLAGVLLVPGFAVSLINGMLYKIVPFLVWLNLRMPVLKGQVPPGTRIYAPSIHEVIAERPMQGQFLLHACALLLLLLSLSAPALWTRPAAVLMLASNLLLLVNLLQAVRLYRRKVGSEHGFR